MGSATVKGLRGPVPSGFKVREMQSSLMRIGAFMKRISAIAEQLDFNRAWELIILAAFRKWLGGNRAKGLLPEPLAMIG